MPILATNEGTGTKREPIPAGMYPGRCYSMIHIGTIEEDYQGKPKKVNKVRFSFELPTELKVFNEEKGEQPQVISQDYTLSMHEKANLRKTLESWRGKAFTETEANSFDVTKLLGIPCMINIIHKTSAKGNVYDTISNITPPVKGMEVPKQINETFEFNYEDKFDNFDKLPEFIKEKVKTSQEYAGANVATNDKGEILDENGELLF